MQNTSRLYLNCFLQQFICFYSRIEIEIFVCVFAALYFDDMMPVLGLVSRQFLREYYSHSSVFARISRGAVTPLAQLNPLTRTERRAGP